MCPLLYHFGFRFIHFLQVLMQLRSTDIYFLIITSSTTCNRSFFIVVIVLCSPYTGFHVFAWYMLHTLNILTQAQHIRMRMWCGGKHICSLDLYWKGTLRSTQGMNKLCTWVHMQEHDGLRINSLTFSLIPILK